MARQGAVLLVVVACLALFGAGAGGSAQRLDYAAVALDVLPPGESGDLRFPPTASDQLPLYDAAQMLKLLVAWSARGAHRLDLNGDGKIDDPGAAIMDAAWPRIADAMMRPMLGPLTDRLKALVSVDDHPNPQGDAFFSGWYSYAVKSLTGAFPGIGRFCGDSAEACRGALWSAIDAAGRELAKEQGPDPAQWRADATAERIHFGFLPKTARWVNRATFQQSIWFDSHRPR